MKIVIPIFDGFTALDAVGPYEILARVPGAEVVFTASARGAVRNEPGSLGIVAETDFDDVREADILLVPGGPATRTLLADETLIEWIRAIHPTTTSTTSVCTGALLLGAADVLRGLAATTHWLELERLRDFGARPSQERVVVDGKVITAAGVSAGIDMALRLVSLIAGDDVARAIQLSVEYDPEPPFDAGSTSKAPQHIVDIVRKIARERQPVR
jgi:putative intracellular protease/amidase